VHASHLHNLDEGESLASYPGHFTPQRKILGYLLNKRSCVGSSAGMGNPVIILVELLEVVLILWQQLLSL